MDVPREEAMKYNPYNHNAHNPEDRKGNAEKYEVDYKKQRLMAEEVSNKEEKNPR
jgi:hypothetical protein